MRYKGRPQSRRPGSRGGRGSTCCPTAALPLGRTLARRRAGGSAQRRARRVRAEFALPTAAALPLGRGLKSRGAAAKAGKPLTRGRGPRACEAPAVRAPFWQGARALWLGVHGMCTSRMALQRICKQHAALGSLCIDAPAHTPLERRSPSRAHARRRLHQCAAALRTRTHSAVPPAGAQAPPARARSPPRPSRHCGGPKRRRAPANAQPHGVPGGRPAPRISFDGCPSAQDVCTAVENCPPTCICARCPRPPDVLTGPGSGG